MRNYKQSRRGQKKHRKTQFLMVCFSCFLLIGLVFYYDFFEYLNLENFKNHKDLLLRLAEQKPLFLMLTLFISYFSLAVLSLPGTMFFAMLAGFLFGFWKGVLLVSIAITLGCFISFLFFNIVLRRFIINKIPENWKYLLAEMNQHASYYLFAMRMIFVIPFIVPNFLMSLTDIKPRKYLIISYLANLPLTIIFVQAGLQISKINHIQDLLSFSIISSLAFLGCFPIIIKKVLKIVAQKKKLEHLSLLKQK